MKGKLWETGTLVKEIAEILIRYNSSNFGLFPAAMLVIHNHPDVFGLISYSNK